MKTAMQELIEHIQVNATKFSLMNTYNILKEIEPYLEKEKEQIKDAFEIGISEGLSMENNTLGYDANPEEYYNQTYNQTYNQNK